MRRLGEFPDPDGLSELLLRLTVNSTVYCFFMTSPWGFKVPARPVPAFHILTAGGGWLEVDGQPEPIRLSAGDIAILPRGEGHVVRDSPKTSSLPWLDRVLADESAGWPAGARWRGSSERVAVWWVCDRSHGR